MKFNSYIKEAQAGTVPGFAIQAPDGKYLSYFGSESDQHFDDAPNKKRFWRQKTSADGFLDNIEYFHKNITVPKEKLKVVPYNFSTARKKALSKQEKLVRDLLIKDLRDTFGDRAFSRNNIGAYSRNLGWTSIWFMIINRRSQAKVGVPGYHMTSTGNNNPFIDTSSMGITDFYDRLIGKDVLRPAGKKGRTIVYTVGSPDDEYSDQELQTALIDYAQYRTRNEYIPNMYNHISAFIMGAKNILNRPYPKEIHDFIIENARKEQLRVYDTVPGVMDVRRQIDILGDI